MDEQYISRLTKLVAQFSSQSFDAFIVSVPENRYYLSGFSAEDGGPQETSGYLVISPDNRYLVTDGRYEIQARREAPLYEVIVYEESLLLTVAEILKNIRCGKVGFEGHYLTYTSYSRLVNALKKVGYKCEIVATEDFVENLRMIKDSSEIELIEFSVGRTEDVLSRVAQEVKEGVSEREIALLLEMELKKSGAEKVAFDPIVASGPNGALPHAKPTKRSFADGDAVVIDVGGKFNHYCSDMTRTLFVGSATEEKVKVYKIVREAQKLAISSTMPGKTSKEIDSIARNYIASRGYGDFFVHGLGHGVGLAVHEKPGINKRTDTKLAPGMVITIEPGVYIKDLGGIRLEDMVLVTKDGCRVLNRDILYYEI